MSGKTAFDQTALERTKESIRSAKTDWVIVRPEDVDSDEVLAKAESLGQWPTMPRSFALASGLEFIEP